MARYDGSITAGGALAEVIVGPVASMGAAGLPVPEPVRARAVIDTGSGSTHVISRIILDLNLNPTGEFRRIRSMGIPGAGPLYDVRITLGEISFELPVIGGGPIDKIPDDDELGPPPQVILGCDWLSHLVMTWNGPDAAFTLESGQK